MLTRNLSKRKIPTTIFNSFVSIPTKQRVQLIKNTVRENTVEGNASLRNRPRGNPLAGSLKDLGPFRPLVLANAPEGNASVNTPRENAVEVNPLAGAFEVFGALPPLVLPRKSCMLLGHGNTLSREYIVLPNDIDATFYTEKGLPLTTANNVLSTYNNENMEPKREHHIEAKSMMFNMSIKFSAFYQYNSTKKVHGNVVNPRLTTLFGYSGIISKPRSQFTSLYHLSDDIYLRNGAVSVHGPYNTSVVLKNYYENLPISIQLKIRNGFSPNSPEVKKIIKEYETLHTQNCKIINFGENIYGLIIEGEHKIEIINTIPNPSKNSPRIRYDDLYRFMTANRIRKGSDPIVSEIPEEIFTVMRNISFIHHNDEIIPKEEIFRARHYTMKLGTILKRIEEYNISHPPHKIKFCHGVVCRNYDGNAVNVVPPVPSGLSASASAPPPAPVVNKSSPTQLIRKKSRLSTYKETFNNIWERTEEAIQRIPQSNIRYKQMIVSLYSNIRANYEKYNFLDRDEFRIIMYLINDNKTKIEELLKKIFRL